MNYFCFSINFHNNDGRIVTSYPLISTLLWMLSGKNFDFFFESNTKTINEKKKCAMLTDRRDCIQKHWLRVPSMTKRDWNVFVCLQHITLQWWTILVLILSISLGKRNRNEYKMYSSACRSSVSLQSAYDYYYSLRFHFVYSNVRINWK